MEDSCTNRYDLLCIESDGLNTTVACNLRGPTMLDNTVSPEKNIECLDYGRSFIRNPSPHNAVRLWIESRTTLFDDKNGTSTHYYQCASCKSEYTFSKRGLLKEDNHDFMPIFGDDDWLIFRGHARITPRYRQVAETKDGWGKADPQVTCGKATPDARHLGKDPRRDGGRTASDNAYRNQQHKNWIACHHRVPYQVDEHQLGKEPLPG